MSLKTIVIACSMLLATSSPYAAIAAKPGTAIEAKEITSISIDYSYRQLKVNTLRNRYLVALEKPCTALRRSDIAFDDKSSNILDAGTELQVGTHNCTIKSIRRDLDGLKTASYSDRYDPRNNIAGPTELRPRR